jgi:hypothetical protein
VPNGAKLRAAIYQARSGRDVLGEVERFFTVAIAAPHEAAAEPQSEAPDFPEAAFALDCRG